MFANMDTFEVMRLELKEHIEVRLRGVEEKKRKLIGEIEANAERQVELEKLIEGQEEGTTWTLYQTMPDEELISDARINILEIEKQVAFLKGRLAGLDDHEKCLKFMQTYFVG